MSGEIEDGKFVKEFEKETTDAPTRLIIPRGIASFFYFNIIIFY